MTTSVTYPTVSPDLIITTPAQLQETFIKWYERYATDPDMFECSDDMSPEAAGSLSAAYLITLLNELNTK